MSPPSTTRAGVAAREALRRVDAMAADAGVRPETRPMPQYPRWGWRRAARFALDNGMLTRHHAVLAARYVWQRVRNPYVEFEGMAFLGPGVDLTVTPGMGRLVIGPWCWIGSGNSVRAHEGSVRLGAKAVLGSNNVVTGWLDIEIGSEALLSDWVYVTDFDHNYDRLDLPIRKQGIRKTPVRIGEDVWVGEKVSILRGADIGTGSVVGSQTVVKRRIPPFSVVVGAPARVLRSRLPKSMTVEEAIDLRRRGQRIPGDPLTDPD